MLRTPDTRQRSSGAIALTKRSFDLELDRGLFPTIALDLVLNGLALVERAQAGLLNGRNVDEHVLPPPPPEG